MVLIRILQVDLIVRNVEVAGIDDRFLFIQFEQMFSQVIFKLHAVIDPL